MVDALMIKTLDYDTGYPGSIPRLRTPSPPPSPFISLGLNIFDRLKPR